MALAFVVAASMLATATAAQAARYYYWAGGERTYFEPSRNHVAVVTPTADRAKALATLLERNFGRGVETLAVQGSTLTLVRLPTRPYRIAPDQLLRDNGFVTLIAFSSILPDGSEAWPTVVLREMRVRFVSAAAAKVALAELAPRGVSVVWSRNEGRDYLLRTPSSERALELAAKLYESQEAEFAYPDLLMRKVRRFTPNDPYYADQWHLPLIGASGAWEISKGAAATVIAIIDDGTDMTHPDLTPNLVGGFDTVGDGYNTDTNPQPTGDDAHGTATAGLAAAAGNNGVGVTGVCPSCKIMPIRIMGGTGYTTAASDESAFYWARTHGAKVMSNSWGPQPPISYNYFPDGLRAEIHAAVAANIPVLFASGNEGSALTCPGGVPWEPAAYNEVIAVGATGYNDTREYYSSYGSTGCPLTIVAPAASVTTDIVGSAGYNSYSSYDYTDTFSGTSAATPVTAGVVGLLLSINPSLSWGSLVSTLKSTADKVGGVTYDANGYNAYYGWGRVNAYRATYNLSTGNVCTPEAGGEVYGSAACSDGRDNDCDSLIDSADPSCQPATVGVGTACASNTQCGTGANNQCIPDPSWPGGYCTSYCVNNGCAPGGACYTCACDTGAGTQSNCSCDPDGCYCGSANGTCQEDTGNPGYACPCDPDCNICLDACLQDSECRDGYICEYVTQTAKACIPGCQSDPTYCATGETCSAITNRCEHDGPTPVGGTCSTDATCSDNGYCISNDPAWPGGYCTPECTGSAGCPASSACAHFAQINLCFATCAEKSDCRAGYGCWPGFTQTAGERVCYPVCTRNSDCATGESCCATTGACEATGDCPADSCTCNTSNDCDTNCDCDLDCCTCDTSAACDSGCTCDKDCTPAACTCDQTYYCDPDCTCDAECPCSCDVTYGCDEGCACDYECATTEKGCGCASSDPAQVAGLGVLGLVLLCARRRRANTNG